MKVDPRESILRLLSERSAEKTISPSQAARAIGGAHWRDLMSTVHAAARVLADEGIVELRQGGERVRAEAIVGWRDMRRRAKSRCTGIVIERVVQDR